MTIETIARTLGLDEKTMALWVAQMRARVPALMEGGMSFDDALTKANDDYRALLIEMAEGKTPRARVARSYLAFVTYAEFNGYEAPVHWAFLETLQDKKLADLDIETIERSLEILF